MTTNTPAAQQDGPHTHTPAGQKIRHGCREFVLDLNMPSRPRHALTPEFHAGAGHHAEGRRAHTRPRPRHSGNEAVTRVNSNYCTIQLQPPPGHARGSLSKFVKVCFDPRTYSDIEAVELSLHCNIDSSPHRLRPHPKPGEPLVPRGTDFPHAPLLVLVLLLCFPELATVCHLGRNLPRQQIA